MNAGLTTPNGAVNYTAAEIAAFEDLLPDEIVVIAFDIATESKLNHRDVLQAYAARHPETIFDFRPYADNIMGKGDVRGWINEGLSRLRWFGLPNCSIIYANEINNPVERGGSNGDAFFEDWENQCTWLISVYGVHKELAPDIQIHLPALSPNGNYQQGWAVYFKNELHLYFDIIDLHIYATTNLGDVGVAQMFGTPIVVTELNQVNPGAFFTACEAAGVMAAAYFILGGTPDWAKYDLLKLPDDYASFKNWQSGGSIVADPTIADLVAKVDQVEKQFAVTVEAFKALADGKYRGADGVDGKIVALQGGADFTGTFEPAPKA